MVETGDTNFMEDEYSVSAEVLGKGSFSIVKSAIHIPSQQQIAAKVLDLAKNRDVYCQETAALRRLSHEHIVKYLHSQTTELDGKGVIYLERLPQTTLLSYLAQNRSIPVHLAMQLFAQLVDAVEHMHKHHVSHSDLKTENIAYDPVTKTLKIFDFGLSQTLPPDTLSHSFVGSPLYMAPEVLFKERYSPYGADIWSLAMILIEMLTGKTPFSSFVCMDELLDFVSFATHVPLPESIPADIRELLRKMLDFNPTTRISISSVRYIIQQLAL